MAQYATMNGAGGLTGFYDDALHQDVPEGAQLLTPEQYTRWLAGQGGLLWQGGDLVAAPPPPSPPAPPAPTAAELMAEIQVLMERVQAMTPAAASGSATTAQA